MLPRFLQFQWNTRSKTDGDVFEQTELTLVSFYLFYFAKDIRIQKIPCRCLLHFDLILLESELLEGENDMCGKL